MPDSLRGQIPTPTALRMPVAKTLQVTDKSQVFGVRVIEGRVGKISESDIVSVLNQSESPWHSMCKSKRHRTGPMPLLGSFHGLGLRTHHTLV
jgi:hypothetical protein